MSLDVCLWVALRSQPLPQTELIIVLCGGSFPHVFEPENSQGFSHLLGGLADDTGLLRTDVLDSFSMVHQNTNQPNKTPKPSHTA